MKTEELRGMVAVVTGASSGIGRATALRLASAGTNLVLAARSPGALAEVRHAAQARGVEALAIPTDVAVQEQVEQLLHSALSHYGKVDIFIASAGLYLRCPVRSLRVEDFEHLMAVNFYGALYGVQCVLPHMLERNAGHIVVLSSLDGKKGLPPDGAYVASKFALTGVMEVLRQELYGTGVHVATVFPGRVDTPMVAGIVLPAASPKVSPERVADAIVRGIVRGQGEIVVPYAGGKALVVLNALSSGLGDWLVRFLKLSGRDEKPKPALPNRLAPPKPLHDEQWVIVRAR